jgi:hypothetical protein
MPDWEWLREENGKCVPDPAHEYLGMKKGNQLQLSESHFRI